MRSLIMIVAGATACTSGMGSSVESASKPSSAATSLSLGSIELCREAIASAEAMQVPPYSLSVILTEASRARLARESSDLVGQTLSVRLGDKILHEVTVLEPLTAAVITLPAQSAEEALAMRQATKKRCPS